MDQVFHSDQHFECNIRFNKILYKLYKLDINLRMLIMQFIR